LEKIAQRHADQCNFDHDCSDCRRTSRMMNRAPNNDWTRAITDWYDEVTLYSNEDVDRWKYHSETGHYTQVVWAVTDKVGCGASSFKNGDWFATLYTCNYGPRGNVNGRQLYKQGPACSDCGEGESCSEEFPGLCAACPRPTPTSQQFRRREMTTKSIPNLFFHPQQKSQTKLKNLNLRLKLTRKITRT